jgi:hypothetical protein
MSFREIFPESRRRQLDGFIIRLMEPLSNEELVDTQYNSIVRRARHGAWQKAAMTTAYHKALLDMATAAASAVQPVKLVDVAIPSRDRCLEFYRKAVAKQLLTPAEQKKDVEWKKNYIAKWGGHLPVSQAEVEEVIRADERFLVDHPVKRERRGGQC